MKNFRRILAAMLTAIILASAFIATTAAASYPDAVINTSYVNVRSGAGLTYDVIGNYSENTKVSLLSTTLYNDDWYHIQLSNGTKGYVYKDYLTVSDGQLSIPSKATGYTGYARKFSSVVNTTGKTITWKSSDTSVATINSSGKMSCKKPGKTTITATVGKTTSKCTLTVVDAEVSFAHKTATIALSEKVKYTATCKKPVEYSSSDTSVAKVASDGTVTPKAIGTAEITAESRSGKASYTLTVKKYNLTLKTNKKVLYSDGYALLKVSGGEKTTHTFKSSDKSVIKVSSGGIVHAVGTGTAKVTCTCGDLSKSITFTVKSGDYVGLTETIISLRKGKTYYMGSTAYSPSWKTSDSSVATVKNGYIKAVGEGCAVVTASTSGGERDCIVRVKPADPVRFVYTSENSALKNKNILFYAITDTTRVDVKFKLTYPNGKAVWLTNPTKKSSDGRYIWHCTRKLTDAGEYKIVGYSKSSAKGSWEAGDWGRGTTFVNDSTSRKAVSFSAKRATTAMIRNVAYHEGFLPTVTMDPLVVDTPTLGYGRVVFHGDEFYNGMTEDEAFAYLVSTVNDSGYTSNLNNTLTKYKIKFNQAQFDALLDFSYNLGAYAISNYSDLLGVLTNSYGKASYAKKAFTNAAGVVLRASASTSAKSLSTLSAYTTVTLVNTKLYGDSFYYVKLKNGTKGYIKSAYLTRRSNDIKVRNLKNVTLTDFRNTYMDYHHASGSCYWGLVYRRLDELEQFFFNDYALDGSLNKFHIKYTCPQNSNTYID